MIATPILQREASNSLILIGRYASGYIRIRYGDASHNPIDGMVECRSQRKPAR